MMRSRSRAVILEASPCDDDENITLEYRSSVPVTGGSTSIFTEPAELAHPHVSKAKAIKRRRIRDAMQGAMFAHLQSPRDVNNPTSTRGLE